jgi:hypothetical protein
MSHSSLIDPFTSLDGEIVANTLTPRLFPDLWLNESFANKSFWGRHYEDALQEGSPTGAIKTHQYAVGAKL